MKVDWDELKRLHEASTKNWNLRRYGVVVGGAEKEYINGSGQSQIAMFSGAEHIHMGERDTNAGFGKPIRAAGSVAAY